MSPARQGRGSLRKWSIPCATPMGDQCAAAATERERTTPSRHPGIGVQCLLEHEAKDFNGPLDRLQAGGIAVYDHRAIPVPRRPGFCLNCINRCSFKSQSPGKVVSRGKTSIHRAFRGLILYVVALQGCGLAVVLLAL